MTKPESGIRRNNRPVTVDVIIRHEGGIVLIRRGRAPFEGHWALPGGFVEHDESVEQAAVREALEETGLHIRLDQLVGVYSRPDRDILRHTVAICFTAHVIGGTLKGGDDAAEAQVVRGIAESRLAFDHAEMLTDAGIFHGEREGFTDHD